MSKALLSNSTVSLASVELNAEFIKDNNAVLPPDGQTSKQENGADQSQLRQRVPKPLEDIDRYTMCSNRIV